MEKEKKHIIFKILIILILLIVLFILYGRYINPYQFKVIETPIKNNLLPASYNGFKIVHFSDLHYKRTIDENDLKNIVNEINKLKADVVVFTGDLFDSKPTKDDIKVVTKYFKKINCKLKKMAVIGDYDQKYLDEYKDILNNSDFVLLDNNNSLIYYKNNIPLNFIGFTKKINNELYIKDYLNITLIHKPDLVKNINEASIVLAGHSLGGQIRLPFIGGLIKKDGAKTYLDSYYKIDNTNLYISNGLGTEKVSFRTFNTPSITLYRLYNK